MSKNHLENSVFQLLNQHLPHNRNQLRRFATACQGVQLAKSTHLSHIARALPHDTMQESRIRFLSRFFMSDLFTDKMIYHPLLIQALSTYRTPMWHLTIDRTNWIPDKQDLLMVSLSYRKRAIPVAWDIHDFGPTHVDEQIALLERVRSILPQNQPVTLHGDAEFGSVQMMRFLRTKTSWEYILGQRSRTKFHAGDEHWQRLIDLPVTSKKPFYASNVTWTQSHKLQNVQFFAFFKPYQNSRFQPKKKVRYFTTSLPITPPLRRLGRKRWGCEPMFRDFKSAGWQITKCGLPSDQARHNLLTLLSFNYLWASSLGRWLCKASRRGEIDPKKRDIILSFGLALIG